MASLGSAGRRLDALLPAALRASESDQARRASTLLSVVAVAGLVVGFFPMAAAIGMIPCR